MIPTRGRPTPSKKTRRPGFRCRFAGVELTMTQVAPRLQIFTHTISCRRHGRSPYRRTAVPQEQEAGKVLTTHSVFRWTPSHERADVMGESSRFTPPYGRRIMNWGNTRHYELVISRHGLAESFMERRCRSLIRRRDLSGPKTRSCYKSRSRRRPGAVESVVGRACCASESVNPRHGKGSIYTPNGNVTGL